MSDDLDGLVRELELTAERIRTGELGSEEAAEAVERCAELAGRIGSELDRRGREAEDPGSGQEQLL